LPVRLVTELSTVRPEEKNHRWESRFFLASLFLRVLVLRLQRVFVQGDPEEFSGLIFFTADTSFNFS
jgi:hypothetical protein